MLAAVLPKTGKARRVGITGVPGAGKSTFIDALGMHLIQDCREKVAVLSVDPSSPISGGSILGDRTRMERLSVDQNAFIRTSPARGHLGGVGRRTRETILLCEAAGYQNILVETIGVGQSETAVRSMTDFFLLIMLAGRGRRTARHQARHSRNDRLHGDQQSRWRQRAKAEAARLLCQRLAFVSRHARRLDPAGPHNFVTNRQRHPEVWRIVLEHRTRLEANGYLAARRKQQALEWMRELISDGLTQLFQATPAVAHSLPLLEDAVRNNKLTPAAAARSLLATLEKRFLIYGISICSFDCRRSGRPHS